MRAASGSRASRPDDQVEVGSILHGLLLRDPLEVKRRAALSRVDEPRLKLPVLRFFKQGDVLERSAPEALGGGHVVGVERELQR
jgi:hypothetical protein